MPLTRNQRQRVADIAKGRSPEPLRVLEGRKNVLEALDAGAVRELWVSRALEPEARTALEAAAASAKVRCEEVEPNDIERLSDTMAPQGVLALVADTARPLADVLALPGLLVWLDGVQDPGNVGAVVRAAAAFGAAGLLVGAGSADPLGLKALRASAGLALRLPFARGAGAEIAAALRAAKRPAWLLENGGSDVFAAPRIPPKLVLVLGSEGSGCSPEARALAERTVGIAIRPGVESLNAAVAVGIALAVLARRTG